jgi:hypothetical protein
MVDASASSSGNPNARQQWPRSIIGAHPVVGSGELIAEQHLGEFVSACRELIQDLALRQKGRFFKVVKRA